MAEGDIFVYAIVGFFAGLYFFYKGFGWLNRKRLIENTPTSKIRSIAMGLVEVYGEALPAFGKILKSPLSAKDCVYYKYKIEEYRRAGKHSTWVTVKEGAEGIPFFLRDETGAVLVDPNGCDADIPQDFQFQSGTNKDPPASIRQFLAKNDMSFEGFLGINKTMKYAEYYIAPKDKLFIMGNAGDNPYVEEATGTENAADIMIQKGDKNKFYYISDRSEKKVLKDLGTKTFLGIYGGAALTVICLAVMLGYLGML
ncbi:MAG: hypothetical protein HYX24_01075 [Candidatus Aenigmarchaeota archaeon]|nr:hypothetical protein [Candidatus Aenigmarchaeota archaeon]